jgi:cholesterol transport system auxiliary component
VSWRQMACAGGIAVTLAACSIGRPMLQATTYLVDPSIEAKSPSVPRRPETLRVGSVRVAATYAGSALVYRLDDVRYVADPYHAFVTDSGAMLGGRMADWLGRTGPFSNVVPPGSTQSAPYVLEVTVEDLYGDFREGSAAAAVVSMQFILIDQASPRQKVAYERTIVSRVKLPKASPDALVRGYGTAIAEILSQVATDLSKPTVYQGASLNRGRSGSPE